MTHPLMLLLGALLAAFLTGVASECDRFRGFEVAFSFNNEVHRFKFAGAPIDLYGQLAEQAVFATMGTFHFTQRGHVLLGLLNELIEFRFDVKHGERVGVDGKKRKTITSPQLSVAPELFYVCNATDKICDLRGEIVGNIDLPSATVLGDVLITGDSSINITSGAEVVVDTELKYVPGNIFDPANGQAYDTTPNENGQLIGVLRGKKIYVQECSGDRTAINSIKYGCMELSDNCQTLFLDTSALNCFVIDGCEIAYGPQTIFPSVAIVPKNPISKDEIDSTAPPPTPSTLSPTSTSTAPPTTTTTEPPPRYIVLKTPPGYKKREDRLAQMEEDEDEYEDDEEEEFDITEWYFSIFAAFVVIVLSGVWAALTWVDWHRRRRLMRAYERRQAAVQ